MLRAQQTQTFSYPSVQFSSVAHSLWPHGLQHTWPPCPSSTPRVYSNSCPLVWWRHPAISSSVVLFPFHLQSFPASESFKGVRSLHEVAKVLEFQLQDENFQWTPRLISFRMDWLDLLGIQGTLKSLFQHHTVQKHQFFHAQLSL